MNGVTYDTTWASEERNNTWYSFSVMIHFLIQMWKFSPLVIQKNFTKSHPLLFWQRQAQKITIGSSNPRKYDPNFCKAFSFSNLTEEDAKISSLQFLLGSLISALLTSHSIILRLITFSSAWSPLGYKFRKNIGSAFFLLHEKFEEKKNHQTFRYWKLI